MIYELCNEPKQWGDGFSDALIEDIDSLYTFVRDLAPHTMFLCFTPSGISASSVSNMVEKAQTIDYANTAVAYHLYGGDVANADAIAQAGYPTMCSEIPSDTDEKTDFAGVFGQAHL